MMPWLSIAGVTLWIGLTFAAAVSPASPAASLSASGEADAASLHNVESHSSHMPLMRSERDRDDARDEHVKAIGATDVSHAMPTSPKEPHSTHQETAAFSTDEAGESLHHHDHEHRAHHATHEAHGHRQHHDSDEPHNDEPATVDLDKKTESLQGGTGSPQAAHSSSTTGPGGQSDAAAAPAKEGATAHKMAHEEPIEQPLAASPIKHHASVGADGSVTGELAELDFQSEIMPALGMNNPQDMAYRMMDMMMGIASVIPEDYPFACICMINGMCQENVPPESATPCPQRIGQKAGAALAGPAAMVVFAPLVLALVRLS